MEERRRSPARRRRDPAAGKQALINNSGKNLDLPNHGGVVNLEIATKHQSLNTNGIRRTASAGAMP